MMKKHQHGCALVLALIFGIALTSFAEDPATGDWADLARTCAQAGLDTRDTERIMERCRELEFSPQSVRAMLTPACNAALAGMTVSAVLAKIEEGLGKNAPPSAIAEAARNRFRHMEQARTMTQKHRDISKRGEQEVVCAVALARESGVSDAVLEEVLDKGRRRRAAEMRAVVEAGETLALRGFGLEANRTMMVDCLERNLRRTEIVRTVRYAVQRHGAGMEPRAIRKGLWGGDAAGTDRGGSRSRQARQHSSAGARPPFGGGKPQPGVGSGGAGVGQQGSGQPGAEQGSGQSDAPDAGRGRDSSPSGGGGDDGHQGPGGK